MRKQHDVNVNNLVGVLTLVTSTHTLIIRKKDAHGIPPLKIKMALALFERSVTLRKNTEKQNRV